MKKNISLLILSLITTSISAQVAVSGAAANQYMKTDPSWGYWRDFNQTFLEDTFQPTYYNPDVSAKVFRYSDPTPPNRILYILRKNNYWQLHQYGPYQNIRYRSKNQYSDNTPPCTAVYEEFQNWEMWYDTEYGSPVKVGEVTLTLSGDCTASPTPYFPPSNSVILTPSSYSLPRQSNTQILAIPSPQPGMMTWSLDDSCVKVYNGSSWNCL